MILGTLAMAEAHSGQIALAESDAREGYQLAAELGQPHWLPVNLAALARVAGFRGREQECQALTDQVIQTATRHGLAAPAGVAVSARAELDLARPGEGDTMAASIEMTGDSLVVHIEGMDKLWSLKSRLEIPLANVVSAASASAEARNWLHGIRVGGSHVPGVVTAGRFYSHDQLVFWDVHDPDKAIGIELRDERYARLVIEVADPEAEIRRISQSVPAARS